MNRTLLPIFLLAVIPVSLSFLPNVETASAPGLRANRVMLFRAFPYEVRPGGFITLDGSGFSKASNKVLFNGTELATASSSSGTNIILKVPSTLSEGTYELAVSNVLGSSSDNTGIKVSIKVTSSPQPAPKIESASVSGDIVTLRGSGFTSSNSISTTLGNFPTPLAANGETLSFRLSELSMYNQVKQSFSGRNYITALWIFVQNEHGVNREPYKLETAI